MIGGGTGESGAATDAKQLGPIDPWYNLAASVLLAPIREPSTALLMYTGW